jgi:dTDP-4-amino-4,6-dideoxygalactose transaminase
VFADIHPDTFNVDARLVIDRITDRTKAIIMVHLYGQPADFDALVGVAGAGIDIIEDCAQAHGATVHGRKVGGFGRASAFSFFPTKTLGAAGDAGMVCTDDDELAAAVRMLRVHGSRQRYESEEIGINSRLDEMQAAMLRIKLRRLDAWNKERKAIAATYGKWLEGVSTPLVMPGVEHVYHQYTIRSTRRDEIAGGLRSAEIASNIYYPTPLHLQPCFSDLGYRAGDLPVCELAAREVLSLPIFPGMTSEEIDRVCSIANAS